MNQESLDAYNSSSAEDRARMREQVYRLAVRRGKAGVTTDEVAEVFDTTPNAVSGRLTELKDRNRLCETSLRRKTRLGRSARVLIADVISESIQ